MELDVLDRKAADAFDGYIVRKDLVRQFSRQFPVPTYVVEFMLGRYCATTDEQEIQDGLAIVQRQLAERTVRAGNEELIKSVAREKGQVRIIDIISARLDARTDSYVAELPSLKLRDVRIAADLVTEHQRMLTGGFYAEVSLGYDATIAQEKNGRPFRLTSLQNRVFFGGALSGGDINGVNKTISGLLKLLYPAQDAIVSDEDLEWAVRLALEQWRARTQQAGTGRFSGIHPLCRTEPLCSSDAVGGRSRPAFARVLGSATLFRRSEERCQDRRRVAGPPRASKQ